MGLNRIVFEVLSGPPIEERVTETVERKGLGHPDVLMDGIAEVASRSYSNFCLKEFGGIPHHNFDKVVGCGGKVRKSWGGGEVLEPSYVLITGQGVTEGIPEEIVTEAAREYLQESLPNSSPKSSVINTRIKEGSSDLRNIFNQESRTPLSNDSSFGVGYAPYSRTESLVLELENRVIPKLRKRNPAVGEDVKIAATRIKENIGLTLSVPGVDKHLESFDDYQALREDIKETVKGFTNEKNLDTDIRVNAGDDLNSREIGSVYVTVTGTSFEQGDNGQTGRGNDVSGLSKKSWRPETRESVCGKNPVNHIGKLYNLTAQVVSWLIVEETEAEEAQVELYTEIGQPLDQPIKMVRYRPDGVKESKIKRILSYTLNDGLDRIRNGLLQDKINPRCRITHSFVNEMKGYLGL